MSERMDDARYNFFLIAWSNADLEDAGEELFEALRAEREENQRLKDEIKARCDHSELLHEIDELTRHNKVLQRADMHREKIWKKRVAKLEALLPEKKK